MTFNPELVKQQIVKIVTGLHYKPQKAKKFLTQLGLTKSDVSDLKKLVKQMVKDQVVEYGSGHLIVPVATAVPNVTDDIDTKIPYGRNLSDTDSFIKRSQIQRTSEQRAIRRENLVIGKFQRKASGFGFVRPNRAEFADEAQPDIFIPPHFSKDAASGDTVAVEIMGRHAKDDYGQSTKANKRKKERRLSDEDEPQRGPMGRIVEIVTRTTNRFVGTYTAYRGWGYVQIDGSIFKKPVALGDASASAAKDGDKIVVEMINFPTPYSDGEAVVVEIIGPHGVPGNDTLLVLRQFNLPDHFSEGSLKDARKAVDEFFKIFADDSTLPPHVLAETLEKLGRKDLTRETIITIDPADAKDFDDAISLKILPNGHYELGVHIADVTNFVPPTSAIDQEAKDRATSVYLPDRVLPMLPEVLSNALASLQPGKIRYAISVFMTFNKEGVRLHTNIAKSAIRSAHRFNYTEVQEFFDKPQQCGNDWKPEVRELLLALNDLAKLLRRKRFDRGSLEMMMPETKLKLDDDGKVVDAFLYPYYDSNKLIEECMLAANEAVACFLEEKKVPFLRRIHGGPSLKKLRGFTQFVASLEIAELDAEDLYQDRKVIQNLLDTVKGTPHEYAVNMSLLRSMQKAVYSPDTEGHYALASTCYCHFTSPIRRYPDLTVHRLLTAILQQTAGGDGRLQTADGRRNFVERSSTISAAVCRLPSAVLDMRELVLLGEHCSDREQRAEEAERELVKMKLIDYMSRCIGDTLEAIVTSVEQFGVFVMGCKIPAEGLIRLEGLTDDVYRYDRDTRTLVGRRAGSAIRIGDRMTVQVTRADVDARQIDFRLVERLHVSPAVKKMKKAPVRRVKKRQ